MPTYEYACTRCGTHIEVFQRFGDEPLSECGVCGGALRKVFHPAGIVFKGSGFYATDSRASASKKGSGASGDGGPEKTAAAEGTGGEKKDAKKTAAAEGTGGEKKDAKKDAPASGAAAKEKSA